jgi:hypothetical protein
MEDKRFSVQISLAIFTVVEDGIRGRHGEINVLAKQLPSSLAARPDMSDTLNSFGTRVE